MYKYIATILLTGLLFSSSLVAAPSKYLNGLYVGYGYFRVNYQLAPSGSSSTAAVTSTSKMFILGKRITDWATVELATLYSSSVDRFDDSTVRNLLGHDFEMEINNYHALNLRAIAYQYNIYDVHGVLGWSRLRYLDQDNASASGSGFNVGLGIGAQVSKKFYLTLGWEQLPRVDYDDNIWRNGLDPMHVEASQIKFQLNFILKPR